jgi:hypothetical protein
MKTSEPNASTRLAQGVYALTQTKRRRWLWCAWWKSSPAADPFVAPDAWGAGLRTEAEAIEAAQTAAGMTLQRVEGRWAGAWVRHRAGLPAFIARPPKAARPISADALTAARSPFTILGISSDADAAAIRVAYRKLALTTHPDRGGNNAVFIAARRAYESAMRRTRRKT